MLPPITRNYDDRSTEEYFFFVFYCDECGKPWESEKYPFYLTNSPALSEAEKRAHKILWEAEHYSAYERANTEALFHFSRCQKCGRRLCDDCFSEFESICLSCEKAAQNKED